MKIDVDYFEYKETIGENMKLIAENHDLKERVATLTAESTVWESKFYDEVKKTDKALKYIDEVWEKTSMPTNTIVALRTLQRILIGEDKE